jgi:hypothetical protein
MASYNNQLFLFGGIQTITKERNDIYSFDLERKLWIKVQENCNESYKLSEQHLLTENSTPSPNRRSINRSSHQYKRSHGCRFNLTLSSFGGVGRNTVCQFAETSLYRKRG